MLFSFVTCVLNPSKTIIGGTLRTMRQCMRRWLPALCVIACVSGCSAIQLGYNQAPAIGYYVLDDYLEFDAEQTPRAHKVLNEWFVWHRRSELPQYAALLSRARGEVTAPTTAEQACAWFDLVNQRFDVALERALPGFADLMRRLSPEQLAHLESKYAETNQELADDYLLAQPEARTKANLNRALKRFEMVYGRMDGEQRERIARLALKTPFDPVRWLAERRLRQQDALQTLAQLRDDKASLDTAVVALRGLVQRSRSSPRADYRTYQRQLVQFNCSFAAEVHNLTTTEQRAAAAEQLKAWEADARALAAKATQ